MIIQDLVVIYTQEDILQIILDLVNGDGFTEDWSIQDQLSNLNINYLRAPIIKMIKDPEDQTKIAIEVCFSPRSKKTKTRKSKNDKNHQ